MAGTVTELMIVAFNVIAGELQANAGSLELIEQAAERLCLADAEGKVFELFRERVARIVTDPRDRRARGADGERLEHIVHLRRFELKHRRFAGRHLTLALKKPDAMLVKSDLSDGQIGAQGRYSGDSHAQSNTQNQAFGRCFSHNYLH